MTAVLDRWKKAVVHLEGAADSEDPLQPPFVARRDMRIGGTALFVISSDRHYLVTARHVLYDTVAAERASKTLDDPRRADSAKSQIEHSIFNMVFRVASLDEFLQSRSPPQCRLMNLGAGPQDSAAYTYSAPELDLAVVSLNGRAEARFAAELLERGYAPIPVEDFADEPSAEGADILAVGYPATSTIESLGLAEYEKLWASNAVSLPTLSFGKVAMLHTHLPFFWADMSIYPGNSGGPVVEGSRLVGIVSAQAVTPIDAAPSVTIRIPFGKIIKAKFVRDLLETQKHKDAFVTSVAAMMKPHPVGTSRPDSANGS